MGFEKIKESLESLSIGSLSLLSIISVVLLFLICVIVIRILMKVVKKLLDRTHLDQAIKSFVNSGAKALLWIVAIIIIAGKLGVDTASLVAMLGVAGLALSLSIQGVLSNLFSGFTILSTRPFSADDYVELDGTAGTVKNVGLFYTTLSTVDNKMIHIPNGQVPGTKIINFTEQDKRRLDLSFTVSYDAGAEDVKKALLEAANADPRVISDPAAPFAGLLAYKDSNIEYVLRAWVSSADYWDVYFALNENVRKYLDKYGIAMSYPHMNVHLSKD